MGTKKPTREKIKAARKRLKDHVRAKGEKCDFDLTETFCYYWWGQLNTIIFDGILTPPVRFEFGNFRAALGWCIPWRVNSKQRRVRIGIHNDLWDRKEFLCVLSHEMVHQWEWEILADWNPRVAHGKQFMDWKPKIRYRAGLPLEKSY